MIAIISCCGCNISSVQYAFQRIGTKSILTTDPKIITAASHVILPGVGHARHAMNKLNEYNLVETIKNLKQPVLGICLGMQLLYSNSEEGDTECLGIIPEKITKLPHSKGLTIPHIGWNTLESGACTNPLTNNTTDSPYVYFVHSYYAPIGSWTLSETFHGVKFTSIVKRNNFFGMQFHPEKSGSVGEELLINFIKSE